MTAFCKFHRFRVLLVAFFSSFIYSRRRSAYVGHDTHIGDDCVVSNSVSIAGHVELQPGCVLGGHCALHQRVRIGRNAMVGGMSPVRRDVLPWTVVSGSPATLRGLNTHQLFPLLSFAGRRAALALYYLLFPTKASFERARHLPLPRPAANASLKDRLDILDSIDIEDLLRVWEEFVVRGGALKEDGDADFLRQESQFLKRVFSDIAQFARESEPRRGLCVPP